MDLEITNLDLAVAKRTLLRSLNATCRAGQLWCVLGKNGAGKSLLLKTLAGIRPVQSGTVSLADRVLARWPIEQLARQRAYLPQQSIDSFSSSVLDTVLTGRYPYHSRLSQRFGLESQSDALAAHAAMAELGLEQLAARDVLSLSGGERAQVALATIFAQQVDLLLLDEPAAHLDVDVSQRLFEKLREKAGQGRARSQSCCTLCQPRAADATRGKVAGRTGRSALRRGAFRAVWPSHASHRDGGRQALSAALSESRLDAPQKLVLELVRSFTYNGVARFSSREFVGRRSSR
jgi:ABC-type cobalamin/Fe3+-siderophores transport system ATPase subunit